MAEAAGARALELVSALQEAREAGDARRVIVAELAFQAEGCAPMSPLYHDILVEASADAGAGGPVWRVLRDYAGEPPFSALALRMMAAVHRLVLEARAPALAAFYPSSGGAYDRSAATRIAAWQAFRAVLEEHEEEVATGVARPCQTNEPGRAAALVGGFLAVARETGLPLRVLEVGASAGLILRWDHFRYVAGGESYGPPGSAVVFDDVWEAPPALDIPPGLGFPGTVVERLGVDPRPQDPTRPETRMSLMASAWPDQVERFHVLAGALEVARQVPAVVETGDGPTWLMDQLATPRAGVATVVYHSIVMQYLDEGGRARLAETIRAAGQRATAAAPLAWLSLEPGDIGRAHVNLAVWPGGERRFVATSGYHGRPVNWLG